MVQKGFFCHIHQVTRRKTKHTDREPRQTDMQTDKTDKPKTRCSQIPFQGQIKIILHCKLKHFQVILLMKTILKHKTFHIIWPTKHIEISKYQQYLGRRVGTQATLAKAESSGELILASSTIPPDLDSGPTGSTLHRISSLQNSTPPTNPPAELSDPSLCWLRLIPPGSSTGEDFDELDGMLWWDVVNNNGKTGWHVALFVRNRWPQALEAWATLTTVENLELSEKLICHWFSDPFRCFEINSTLGINILSFCPGELLPVAGAGWFWTFGESWFWFSVSFMADLMSILL